MANFIYFKI